MKRVFDSLIMIGLVINLSACSGGSGDPDAQFKAGLELQQAEKFAEAIEAYDSVLASNSEHLGALINRGLAKIDLEQFAEAVKDFDQAAALAPNDPDVFINRGIAGYGIGQYAKALEDFFKGEELDPLAVDIYIFRGRTWVELKEYEAAVVDYTNAIRLEPDDVDLYLERKGVHEKTGADDLADVDQMLAEMTLETINNPDDVDARVARALAMFELEEYEIAMQDLDNVLTVEPKNVNALLTRAHCHLVMGDNVKALADYTTVIDEEPSAAQAFAGRAIILETIGSHEKAAEDFKNAVRLDDEDDFTMARYAWLLATCKEASVRNGARAVTMAELACKLTQDKEWFNLDALAAAHAEVGNFNAAIAAIGKALVVAPDDMKAEISKRLALYQSSKPYRDVPDAE